MSLPSAWYPVVELGSDDFVLPTSLTDPAAPAVVALDSLILTWGRDQVLSAVEPRQATLALLIRDPWWLRRRRLAGEWVKIRNQPADPSQVPPDVLTSPDWQTFIGRVLPESVQANPSDRDATGWIVTLTAVDLAGWAASIMVADTPWPAETIEARLARLSAFCLARGGFDLDWADFVPAGLAGTSVAVFDIDNRSLADVVDDHANTLGIVADWTGEQGQVTPENPPTLRAQAPARRAELSPPVWNAHVDPAGGSSRPVILPGNVMSSTEPASRAGLAVNDVRVTWTDTGGTERTTTASRDDLIALYGTRSLTVPSLTTSSAAATAVATSYLAIATKLAGWQHPPATLDEHRPAARIGPGPDPNLIPNPSFETDLARWGTQSSPTGQTELARQPVPTGPGAPAGPDGDYYGLLVITGTASAGWMYTTATAFLPVEPNTEYEFSFWVRAWTASAPVDTMRVRGLLIQSFTDAPSAGFTLPDLQLDPYAGPSTTWQRYRATWVTPANVAGVQAIPYLFNPGSPANAGMQIDGVYIGPPGGYRPAGYVSPDTYALALLMLAPQQWTAPRAVMIAGSLYNRLPPEADTSEQLDAPLSQIIGGQLEFSAGHWSTTINLAPAELAAGDVEPVRWEQVDGATTWAQLDGSAVDASITWDDLAYFTGQETT